MRRVECRAQHLLDDLLLLNQEGPHNPVLDHSVAEVATIDAVHRLGGSRQPLVAHLLRSEGLDLHGHMHPP